MLLPLGILASSGGAALPTDYELISTTVLGSNSASVSLSSIPQTYKHLQIRLVKLNPSSVSAYLNIQMNGVTSGSYSSHLLFGNGSTVGSNAGNGSSATSIFGGTTATNATTHAAVQIIDILDYTSTSKYKTVRYLNGYANGANNGIELGSGLFMSTSAVTSVDFSNQSSNQFATGSRFSIYGLKG